MTPTCPSPVDSRDGLERVRTQLEVVLKEPLAALGPDEPASPHRRCSDPKG